MEIDALTVGILVVGLVVAIALFRFRHVLTKLTFGEGAFSLSAKKERSASKEKSEVSVGDVEQSAVDIAGGSRGSSNRKEAERDVKIEVGSVKKSKLNITGRDDLTQD